MKIFQTAFHTIFVLLVICFVYFVTYTFIEPRAYDFMTKFAVTQRLPFDYKKQIRGNNNTILIIVDNKTITKYRWPWKRKVWCNLFDYLYKYSKPKVIVGDFVITAPDRENPESDRQFYRSIKQFDNLVLGFLPKYIDWEDSQEGLIYEKAFLEKYALNNVELQNITLPESFESMFTYPKEYMEVVKYPGSISTYPSAISGNYKKYAAGTRTRNFEHIINYKGSYIPSSAFRTFLLANNFPKITVSKKYIEFPELNYKIKHTLTNLQSIVPIKFYSIDFEGFSHKKYSACDIIDSYKSLEQGKEPKINPAIFNNKIVVIGAKADFDGINDHLETPMSESHPGADVVATTIDNIMYNDFLTVIPDWINVIITILLMLLSYIIVNKNETIRAAIYSVTAICVYFITTYFCYYYSIVINVITPIVMYIIAITISYAYRYIKEAIYKEKVKTAMGKYISEDVMNRIMLNIDNLGLGGKKAIVTVLFSDIRGFTSLSERMSAQQVTDLLNEYFTAMEPIVSKYNGIINKFIGDAIMAVFGEPIQNDEHAANAVKCGYEMLNKVQELNKKWEEEGNPKIEIGIGINTGEVFIGNVGSENRMEYTVIGDTVNLASRLEGYNKTYKTKMLVSKTTYEHVKKFADVVKIPEVEIRGKANKIDIYEILRVKL